jgi:tetratricopeptide (TPR) repeat protein
MESLNLIIAQTQGKGNAEQIYVFWRMNLHRIDGSLVRSIPNFASQLLRAQSSKEQQILVAITLGKFGDLMQRFPLGNQEINIELAIASHQICASIFTKNEHSRLWAISQKSLGIAYQTWTAGERKENIEQAIQALRASLEVRTSQNFPFEWAMTQNSLGVAYNDRIEGERKENIEQAIHSFQVAQEVHTRQNFPFEWAMTQTNLGNAYGNRIEGEHKENRLLAEVREQGTGNREKKEELRLKASKTICF